MGKDEAMRRVAHLQLSTLADLSMSLEVPSSKFAIEAHRITYKFVTSMWTSDLKTMHIFVGNTFHRSYEESFLIPQHIITIMLWVAPDPEKPRLMCVTC